MAPSLSPSTKPDEIADEILISMEALVLKNFISKRFAKRFWWPAWLTVRMATNLSAWCNGTQTQLRRVPVWQRTPKHFSWEECRIPMICICCLPRFIMFTNYLFPTEPATQSLLFPSVDRTPVSSTWSVQGNTEIQSTTSFEVTWTGRSTQGCSPDFVYLFFINSCHFFHFT